MFDSSQREALWVCDVMADLREKAQAEGEWVGLWDMGRFGIGPRSVTLAPSSTLMSVPPEKRDSAIAENHAESRKGRRICGGAQNFKKGAYLPQKSLMTAEIAEKCGIA